MKRQILIILFICAYHIGATQPKQGDPSDSIKVTVLKFFEFDEDKPAPQERRFNLVKETIIGNLKKRSIDKLGVEVFLNRFKKSGLFSELFINNLRQHFYDVGKTLDGEPKLPKNTIIKIDGLESSIILQTLEPELIYDHYKDGVFEKYAVISNKAIIQYRIKAYDNKMIFTLSRNDGKWLIDTIGYYE
ncbi:hypothetical protein [Pedobacter aquatilis]|uniref:hypothetical protein n=1 Tax=Pedobacter aquatilis TaxID=351343 RepID=UPI002930D99B|nr:hypothetical protein [Pedobacter aquatilis]